MNQQRRKKIEKLCEQFNIADNKLSEAKSELEYVKDEFEAIKEFIEMYIKKATE